MIIDTHVHFFKDELALKARQKLTAIARLPYYTDFTEADTRTKLRQWGVDIGIVLAIATQPGHQENVNNWAQSIQHDGLIACGSVHPDAPDAVREAGRIRELGLHGVKFHPDYQEFFVDDEKAYPVYEEISRLGLPVVFHAGWDPLSPDLTHATPERMARVRDDFPRLKLVAAHMGGVHDMAESRKHLIGTDIMMDISIMPVYRTQQEFEQLVKQHGAHRLMFGSDCPWCMPTDVLRMLEKAMLPAEDMDLILYKNAARLFSIDI